MTLRSPRPMLGLASSWGARSAAPTSRRVPELIRFSEQSISTHMKVSINFRAFVAAFLVALGGTLTGNPAEGATPEAWAAHEKEVVSACAAVSDLRNAKPSGKLVEFDDRVGFTAVIIEGRYPQPHMKNKRGRVLCLFDKRTRTPYVSEADSIVWKREP